jgi:hypothetical protein
VTIPKGAEKKTLFRFFSVPAVSASRPTGGLKTLDDLSESHKLTSSVVATSDKGGARSIRVPPWANSKATQTPAQG